MTRKSACWIGAFLPLLVFVSAAGSGPRAEEAGSPTFTLGDFYLECVRAFRIEPPEGWDRSKAWMLLRATGLKIDGDDDFSRQARQKDVIHIATQLGIRLSAEDENQPLTRKQTEAFLTRFKDYFRLPLHLPAPENRSEDRKPDTAPPAGASEDSQDPSGN